MLLPLAIIALGLTIAMFLSRNSMLGFPSAMFWMILGAYEYTQSVTPWVSVEFYFAIACMLGMVTFCSLAAYGLRERKDTGTDRDEYLDESPDAEYYGEGGQQTEPSEGTTEQPREAQQQLQPPRQPRRVETARDRLRERARNRRPVPHQADQKDLEKW